MVSKCKGLGIALFAILQISVVLCRTTGTPEGHLKENEFVPTSQSVVDVNGKERLRVFAPESFPKGTDIPDVIYDTMEYDSAYDDVLTAYAIVAIVYGVIAIISLIVGCIMMTCCKKPPRTGYVVRSNQGQTEVPGIQSTPGVLSTYPPPYGKQ